MTPTNYRDQVARIAKTDTDQAIEIAVKIRDPWFEAQAWSHLARYADTPLRFSTKAAKAAARTKDDYQRSAVRAWEIAALAEREYYSQARRAVAESVELASSIERIGSRAESLYLLFQAAHKISKEDAESVFKVMQSISSSTHWRVHRAMKDIGTIMNGEMQPRDFFCSNAAIE